MNENYKVLRLSLVGGLKIPDPFGRYRTEVGYVNPPDGCDEVPVVWLERGIAVAGVHFLPYGLFTAEIAVRPPVQEPAEAAEEPEEDEDPSEEPEPAQEAPAAPEKHFRDRKKRR